jgi:hypothetical protein
MCMQCERCQETGEVCLPIIEEDGSSISCDLCEREDRRCVRFPAAVARVLSAGLPGA